MSAATPISSSVHWDPPEVNSGTTTSWIPLTTTWSSVSGCASSFFLFPGLTFPVAWDPGYGYFADGTPRCLPPAATTWWEQNHVGGDGFTSLSIRPIVCPESFTTVATSVQSGSSTAVMCCASGYDLQGGEQGHLTGGCASSLTSGQTLKYIEQSVVSGRAVIATKTVNISSSTTITAIPIQGWNVNTPSSASSTADAGSAASPAVTSTAVSNSGLSTGAKAGIGVGAALGGLGLLAFAAALYLLKKRPRESSYGRVRGPEGPERSHPPHEAPTSPVHELGAQQKPQEMEHHNRSGGNYPS